MSSPARETRLENIARGFDTVIERGRYGIVMARSDNPSKRATDAQVGTPFHFGAGPFGEANEIDTAWTAAQSPWQWEMVKADYNVRTKNLFNGAPLLEYSNPARTEWVSLQPQQLNWNNDRGDVQVAGNVQGATASLSDDLIRYTDAYGTGRHFSYQAHPSQLTKKLIVDSYASFPAPNTQILTGANPVLQLQFLFNWSPTLTVWVDGVQWTGAGGAPTLTTSNTIEFRRGDGTTAFGFKAPHASDANQNFQPAVLRLRRAGNNLFVEVRVSQSWLADAAYPVEIDPTVDATVAASTDDSWQEDVGGSGDPTGAGVLFRGDSTGGYVKYGAARWQITGPASGDTVDVANISWYGGGATRVINANVYCENVDSAAAYDTDTNDISGRSVTSGVLWDAAAGTFEYQTSPSLVTPVQAVISRAGWASGNYLAVVMVGADATDVCNLASYDSSPTWAPKIHIEYTAGGGGSSILRQMMAHEGA